MNFSEYVNCVNSCSSKLESMTVLYFKWPQPGPWDIRGIFCPICFFATDTNRPDFYLALTNQKKMQHNLLISYLSSYLFFKITSSLSTPLLPPPLSASLSPDRRSVQCPSDNTWSPLSPCQSSAQRRTRTTHTPAHAYTHRRTQIYKCQISFSACRSNLLSQQSNADMTQCQEPR